MALQGNFSKHIKKKKKKRILILLKLFQKIEEEELFYEVTINLKPKSDRHYEQQKKKIKGQYL